MEKINKSEIKALISLLDDNDLTVFESVNAKLLEIGVQSIPLLQEAFDSSKDEQLTERLSILLDRFKFDNLQKEITNWSKTNTDSLLNGLLHIARFGYPNLDEKSIIDTINNLAKEIKPNISNKGNYEIMQEMNKVIIDKYNFGKNFLNYSGANISFLNKVIDDKVGNPIMLCIIYLLVAKKIGVNIIGINSPKHFILAILNSNTNNEITFYNDELINQVDFYIDPFNKGEFFGTPKYDQMLREINFNLSDKELLPATNLDIIKRVMNNLIYALHTTGEKNTAKKLLDIVDVL